jgi:lysophospholipase L1-like esterase
MKNLQFLCVAIVVTIALSVAFTMRAAWIREKISALSTPSSKVFAEANAKLPGKGTTSRIVLIGDSRIAQWPAKAWVGPWEIINRGVAGETVAQLSKRFQPDAIALHPDTIVIESGINDLVAASFMGEAARRAVVGRTFETLRELAEAGVASGSSVFVGTVLPPAQPDVLRLPVWRESVRALVSEINTELRKWKLPGNARVFDFSRALGAVDDKFLPDTYRVDTLHMNESAYERLTAALEISLIQVTDSRK